VNDNLIDSEISVAGSSNGRTTASGAVYLGSNPSPAANGGNEEQTALLFIRSEGIDKLPDNTFEGGPEYWQKFLGTQNNSSEVAERYYESFSFGRTEAAADALANLVLDGTKTATATLAWEFELTHKALPPEGSFSIVLNGANQPVCIIETLEVRHVSIEEIDSTFAHDYGEGDKTLVWWKENAAKFYEKIAKSLGKIPSKDMVLICERFRVVFV
jgi:uncharacterized protein YhfF